MATRLLSPRCPSEDIRDEACTLTPRSKIKAMMAAVDDDSDEAAERELPTTGKKRKILGTLSGNFHNINSASIGAVAADNMNRESDTEEEVIVPRGRLAARLKTGETEREKENLEAESSGSECAYTRIKKQLFNGTEKTREKTSDNGRLWDGAITTSRLGTTPSRLQTPVSDNDSDPVERPAKISAGLDHSRNSSPTPRSATTSPLLPAFSSIRNDDLGLAQNVSNSDCSPEHTAEDKAKGSARDATENLKKVGKAMKEHDFKKMLSRDASNDENSDDDLAEKHFTQSARPTRKASKKALEEMNRETQRMNRNMQLAHQAKTKKKISKDSLLARFNFRTSAMPNDTISEHPSSSTIPSSAAQSDCENTRAVESPPTSPAEPIDQPLGKSILFSTGHRSQGPVSTSVNHALTSEEDDLPETTHLCIGPQHLDKGKARITDLQPSLSSVNKDKRFDFKQRPVRVRLPNVSLKVDSVELDSDSDLETPPKHKTKTLKPKSSKLDAFHRLPASKLQEGRSLLTLRALAHLNSEDDQGRRSKTSVNVTDMQISLQKRARLQALEERKAKIDDLKARGILVQTVEEREQDQAAVEDLLEKARREAQELQQKEKKAAKKAKVANGDMEGLDSSDEDDDYADDREDDDDADGESSGSVNEENVLTGVDNPLNDDSNSGSEEDEEDVELDDEEQKQNNFLDAQAEEDSGEKDEEQSDEEVDNEPRELPISRARRNRTAIVDEDDDEVNQDVTEASAIGVSKENEARLTTVDIPRFPPMPQEAGSNVLSLGMTQAFAATLAETQGEAAEDEEEEQDSMVFFLPPPEPDLPLFIAEDSQPFVLDTQGGSTNVESIGASNRIDLHFSQTQLQQDPLGPVELQKETSDLNEIPDPTQDAGFALSSPAPERFVSAPPSMVDTVIFPAIEKEETPVLKPRGRLVRGRLVQGPAEQEINVTGAATPLPRDAFKAMQEKRKKKADEAAFDKKRSKAKEMVEEQAMESEDEYAGLGGASDDESGGEEDQDVKAMMDNGEVDIDEGQLAALYANKERASDEKAVEKLFKDINNGGLRRKRGADFDLSDSDDDGEARRRRKQREFAKMRKALLADEKVGEIAEDPKKLAFLRAIEDREDDEDLDFLERSADDPFRVAMDTQEDGVADSQSQQPSVQATTEDNSGKGKRPLTETNPNMRPPPTARRTAAGSSTRKPATLAEIRDSVSFLVESPGVTHAPDPSSSASEAEDEEDNDHPKRHPRRTASNPIVDRLILKRASTNSSLTSTTTNSGPRLAFYDPNSTTTSDGFKVPSLLRRATTTNLSENGSSSGSVSGGVDKNGISTYAATERAAGGGEERVGGFRRAGGSKKCSVNYHAREMEKRGVVEGAERRRREERERMAKERRRVGGLGGLVGAAGGFD